MDKDKSRIRHLFDEAAELPPAERAAFLDRECGDDPTLRGRVQALLTSLDEAGDFLPPSPADRTPADPGRDSPGPAPIHESAGTRIGPYKLLQQIGEGGFGVVFLAEQQTPVVRRVALKIIKLGMDTKQVIARFEAERQALALMDHPNIARVLDAGATETGRPYFVMELVRGEPITAYCDKHSLSPVERLELFVDICHAIQHAHQKGIVHRDIKPSNILVTVVDGKAIPKVIDFGIAKAMVSRLTERTLFTEHRQLIGTPEYMSPEQAEMNSADIDTRSDIYSLGVLLYELLTGTTPFDRKELREAAFAEILRIIREVEPPKPSTRISTLGDALSDVAARRHTDPAKLPRLVRGDLDWIVMRCLEKDRRRRYETANGLAADVSRHLNGEPVTAAPPSVGYRLAKFVRRNRWGVIVGVGMGTVVTLGLAGTLTFAVRASRQRELSERRAREIGEVADFQARMLRDLDAAEMGRRIQATFRDQVRAALERKLVGPYPDWRPLTPQEIDAELQAFEDRAGVVRAADVARRVLDEDLLRRSVESARKEFADQPAVLARICDAVGSAYLSLGLHEQARSVLTQTLELRRSPSGGQDLDLARTQARLGEALGALGDQRGAESAQREALDIRRRMLGNDHAEVAESLALLAGALGDGKRSAEAEALLRQALALQQELLGDEDPSTLHTMHDLATLLHSRGEFDEAEDLYRRTLIARRKLLGDADLQTAATLSQLGLLLREKGEALAAEPLLREALAAERTKLGDEHEDVASTMENLALVLKDNGDQGGAEELERAALAIDRKLLGNRHPNVALSLNNLGMLLRDMNRFREAEDCLREAVAIVTEVRTGDDRQRAMYLHHLALMLLDEDSPEEGERLARQALEMYRGSADWDPAEFQHARYILARLHARGGRTQEARALVLENLEMRRRAAAPNSEALARELELTAGELDEIGLTAEGGPLLREALDISRALGDEHATAKYLHHLSLFLAGESADAEAEKLVLEAVAIYRAHPEWNAREYRHATIILGNLYTKLGRSEAAIEALRESLVAERRVVGSGTIELCTALERVGYALYRMKAFAEAEPCFREAAEVSRQMHPEGHGRTAAYLRQLGDILVLLGRAEEAEQPLLEAVAISRAGTGGFPGDLPNGLRQLGGVYAKTGRKELAVETICESMEAQRQVVEAGSPALAAALAAVAMELLDLEAGERAEPLLRESIELREKAFPPGDPKAWSVQATRSVLGVALTQQGRFAEAEPLLIGAYEALRDDPNVPKPKESQGRDRRREALDRIVRLYEAWEKAEPGAGHDAQAADWRGKK